MSAAIAAQVQLTSLSVQAETRWRQRDGELQRWCPCCCQYVSWAGMTARGTTDMGGRVFEWRHCSCGDTHTRTVRPDWDDAESVEDWEYSYTDHDAAADLAALAPVLLDLWEESHHDHWLATLHNDVRSALHMGSERRCGELLAEVRGALL